MSVDPRLRAACRVHPLHRVALVGEAPGPRTRADLPLYPYPPNSAAGRLAALIGFSRREYLLTFARANLLDECPSGAFPVGRARPRVSALIDQLAPRDLLLLGRGVATAFGSASLELLTWCEVEPALHPGLRVAVVPHPSGRNLWYNDQANRDRVRGFFEQFRGADLTEAAA